MRKSIKNQPDSATSGAKAAETAEKAAAEKAEKAAKARRQAEQRREAAERGVVLSARRAATLMGKRELSASEAEELSSLLHQEVGRSSSKAAERFKRLFTALGVFGLQRQARRLSSVKDLHPREVEGIEKLLTATVEGRLSGNVETLSEALAGLLLGGSIGVRPSDDGARLIEVPSTRKRAEVFAFSFPQDSSYVSMFGGLQLAVVHPGCSLEIRTGEVAYPCKLIPAEGGGTPDDKRVSRVFGGDPLEITSEGTRPYGGSFRPQAELALTKCKLPLGGEGLSVYALDLCENVHRLHAIQKGHLQEVRDSILLDAVVASWEGEKSAPSYTWCIRAAYRAAEEGREFSLAPQRERIEQAFGPAAFSAQMAEAGELSEEEHLLANLFPASADWYQAKEQELLDVLAEDGALAAECAKQPELVAQARKAESRAEAEKARRAEEARKAEKARKAEEAQKASSAEALMAAAMVSELRALRPQLRRLGSKLRGSKSKELLELMSLSPEGVQARLERARQLLEEAGK